MQRDKLTSEQMIIEEQMRRAVEACQSCSQPDSVIRLPLKIYQWCVPIFKREKDVGMFIMNYCIEHWYIKDVKLFAQSADPTKDNPYMLIMKSTPTVVLYLSQLFIRVFILGLSIGLGEKRRDVAKRKMKQLVKALQLQFIINSHQSFSDSIIKELQLISQHFGCQEFYEELAAIFNKCDTFQVLEWVQRQIQQKRQDFYNKINTPKDAQEMVVKQKKVIKRRVTIGNPSHLKLQTSTPLKNETSAKIVQNALKETNLQKQNVKVEKMSLCALAKKARESVEQSRQSLPKLSHRFVFRSTKKENKQQEEYYYESPPQQNPVSKAKVSLFVEGRGLQEQEEKSSSRALGRETPPHLGVRNRRVTQ